MKYMNQLFYTKKRSTKIFQYVLLLIVSIIMISPFVLALSIALKGPNEILFDNTLNILPKSPTLNNFKQVWNTVPIMTYFKNSCILAFFGVLLPILFSSIAAFPLARMNFKGKKLIFIIILMTMMIPGEVTMIPIYIILQFLNLMDTYTGIIIIGIVTPLNIFLFRQAFLDIPKEIEESAFMDGANTWQVYYKIMLPMISPVLGVQAIICFIGAWNNFLWPLLILSNAKRFPLTLGLYQLQGAFSSNTRLVASGAVLALIPIIIVFIIFQRYFVAAAYSSAVKG